MFVNSSLKSFIISSIFLISFLEKFFSTIDLLLYISVEIKYLCKELSFVNKNKLQLHYGRQWIEKKPRHHNYN